MYPLALVPTSPSDVQTRAAYGTHPQYRRWPDSQYDLVGRESEARSQERLTRQQISLLANRLLALGGDAAECFENDLIVECSIDRLTGEKQSGS
jgi:hypothetical protein